ncbi:Armadillo-like helical [Artemisia annua]|uniref:Armadillo-like helical n=1 Tax=Artemisia annua TaxID=35608 RepID=A0A2U1LSV7_ARTAN|nr:Armadillo-like helical [Artemisia annua]
MKPTVRSSHLVRPCHLQKHACKQLRNKKENEKLYFFPSGVQGCGYLVQPPIDQLVELCSSGLITFMLLPSQCVRHVYFSRELPSLDDDGQVLRISGLWNTAMAHPNDPEIIDLVNAGVIPPLVELLRGRLTWVDKELLFLLCKVTYFFANFDNGYFSCYLIRDTQRAAWLFREATIKHGGIDCEAEDGNVYGQESDDSEWETASESDVGDDGRKEMSNNKEGNVDKINKLSAREMKRQCKGMIDCQTTVISKNIDILPLLTIKMPLHNKIQMIEFTLHANEWKHGRRESKQAESIRASIMKFFRELPSLGDEGLKNRRWLSHDQNIYIPYYAAHIIGSYTMNMEDFAETAVELLKGTLTWYADRRLSYHCDLLTRGMGGVEMESRKAEEWASQLQCWSPQLINCFAFKTEFLPTICKPEFLVKLPLMWGGLVNENSPAELCNIARSSDDWKYMAIDCLLWLLQDPSTFHKQGSTCVLDLVEISALGDHKKLGDSILSLLQKCIQSHGTGRNSVSNRTKEDVEMGKSMPKEDLHIKQAAALVQPCPMLSFAATTIGCNKSCYSSTRVLSLHNSVNRHAKSLWRRAQAYDMLGLAKEILLDAILFKNECSQSTDPDLASRQDKVPDYAEREAAIKHGGIDCEAEDGNVYGQESDDSEWETASESDVGDGGRKEMSNNEKGNADKSNKL